ncbi:MAG TPA: substrate-binding domain-containing protein [Bryobacteraceae bacterium]|nr:substrate-binding domain-containing protein [Bryobacteraceae bacterium]
MKTQPARYLVKSVVHATEVLSAFHSTGEVLRLRDIVERTGFNKAMCFRFLYTLHECGYLEKVGENHYRLASELRRNRRHRIGYASQGQDTSFPREVLAGLTRAAEDEHVELIVLDNRYDAKVALRSADKLVREQVDLVIEFQTDEAMAPAIATRYLEANIPFIAIDIPHPGATYFGANNYEAGLIAGRHLGRWAKKHWGGEVDEVLLLGLSRAGSLLRTRVRAMQVGINEVLRLPETTPVTTVDGDGQFRTALQAVRRHLRTSPGTRILVGAANDPSALGALRAFEEAGRASHCAVVGHNAEPEARAELREPRTRLIGSVGYFPEKYGEGLMRLALDILAHKPVPPACFIKHQLVTPETVDHFYPNDALLGVTRGPA